MKNLELSKRIKELRNRKGFSQEELSEKSGLSLRTIQRIENGETEPRGDSLKKMANALDVTPDELIDWTIQENRNYLFFLNLSALGFILFPLLGILIPFIMLTAKKDKIKDLNKFGKAIVNFEITWNIIVFFLSLIIFPTLIRMIFSGNTMFSLKELYIIPFIVFLYIYNFLFVLINSMRIYNNKSVRFFPKIGFIRS